MTRRKRHDDTTIVEVVGEEPRHREPRQPLTAEMVAAIDGLPADAALLVVERGPNAGARYLLDTERTTVGRNPDADIFLDDVTVSRRHAELVTERRGFAIRDVGSLNGTYVNRQRIEFIPLHAGDEIRIGKFRLTYYPSPRRQAR